MSTKHVVAKANELSDGEMKEVELADQKVLLVKIDGEYHAYAGECPHHGAPLAEGTLCDCRIRCPWHQAVFDAADGKLLQPPALDHLKPFHVQVIGGNVVIMMPKEPRSVETPAMASRNLAEDARKDADDVAGGAKGQYERGEATERLRQYRTMVIIGAGPAGHAAAEQLRQKGYEGNLTMIASQSVPPYDRTELSKRYLRSDDAPDPALRPASFYREYDIDLLLDTTVTKLSTRDRTLTLEDGSEMQYDRVLLATGSRPRTLGVDGEDLENVLTLRVKSDADAIIQAASNARQAVVVGASFIAMEAAAALTERNIKVHVVAPEHVPFARVFGREIGRMYQRLHEEKGTTFHLGRKVESFAGNNGKLGQVTLDNGESLQADLAVVGVGVTPVTDYLSDIETNDDGSIDADATLQVAENVFAAGDIVRLPDWRNGQPMRIEHWRFAQQLGRLAGRNMLGADEEYRDVPFFWTNQHMVITDYVGHAPEWDNVVIDGSVDDREFVAYYLKDGKVHAAAGCSREKTMCLIAEAMPELGIASLEDYRHAPQTCQKLRS